MAQRMDPRAEQVQAEVQWRHRQEARIRERAERLDAQLMAELDAEIDAEEAQEREREREAAAEVPDPDKPLTRAELHEHTRKQEDARKLREQEGHERLQLAEKGVYPVIPKYGVIRAQMKTRRREERRQERHRQAEAAAGIPAKQAAWEQGQADIQAQASAALQAEDERHAAATQEIHERRNAQLDALGDYPSLPPEPPAQPARASLEPSQTVAALIDSTRDLASVQLGPAPEPRKKSRA